MFSPPANLQSSLKFSRPGRIHGDGQPSVYRGSQTHHRGIAGSVLKTQPKLSLHISFFFFFFKKEPYFCLAVDINSTEAAHKPCQEKLSLLAPAHSKRGAEFFQLASIMEYFPIFLQEFMRGGCRMLSTCSESYDLKQF